MDLQSGDRTGRNEIGKQKIGIIKTDRQSVDREIEPEGIIKNGSGGRRRSRYHQHIPEEIIEEHIVDKLPAKSLFRYKTVSKSWFNLIKTDDFIYKHFNSRRSRRSLRQEEEEQEGSYLAMCWLYYDESPNIRPFLHVYLYELCDDIFAAGPSFNSQDNKISIPIPGRPSCIDLYRQCPNIRNMRLVNVCNGILCYEDNGIIMLVNPFLSELKRLPGEFLSSTNCTTCFLGLGFDKTVMDFKVVRMFPWEREAQVYSLRSNTWRKLDATSSGIPRLNSPNNTPCTYFDGNLYWFVSLKFLVIRTETGTGTEKPFPWRILTFNLATERFQLMEMPPYPYPKQGGLYAGLVVSNQESPSLAFVIRSKDGIVNLWTLTKVNDNEEEEVTTTSSWTKQYSIQCSPDFFRPVCFSISKKYNTFIYLTRQVEISRYHLIKYDVMNQSSSTISEPIRMGDTSNYPNFRSRACYSLFQVGVCRPSLFSLNSM